MRKLCALVITTITIGASDSVPLPGVVPPQIAQAVDAGAVSPSFRMSSITLQFRRTLAQQQALDRLLKDQQDPASPEYHKWLTPEQMAERFGLSAADVERIEAWLRSSGFRVDQIARGREWMVFSGKARQVELAFHVKIHRYRLHGKLHYAPVANPSIPAEFAALVNGMRGLDDFTPSPH